METPFLYRTEEVPQGKWVELKNVYKDHKYGSEFNFCIDNDLLLFKNVWFNVKQLPKDEKICVNEYHHTDENWILDFEADRLKYSVGFWLFDTKDNKFWTISEWTNSEDGLMPLSIKIKYVNAEDGQETTLEGEDLKLLQDKLDVKIRVLAKNGKKTTIHGFAYTYENFKKSLADIFVTSGLLLSKYKIFHEKDVVSKDLWIQKLYNSQSGLNFFACESIGKPSVWNRFGQFSSGSSWSNSGNSHDRMVFIPKKPIEWIGFSTYGPSNEDKYYLKYKIELDGNCVLDNQNPVE